MNTRTQIIVDTTIVLAFSVLIHYGIYQNSKISELEHLFTVSTERNRINDDQLRDVTYSLINRSHENDVELAKNQGRSEGILVAIKDPAVTEEYHELWHDGYYQGLSQNEHTVEDISASSYKDGYHTGMDDALRDMGLVDHPKYVDRRRVQDVSDDGPTPHTKAELIKGRAKLRELIEPEFDKKIKAVIEEAKTRITKED